MAIHLHWAVEQDIDRVVQTRVRCYAGASKLADAHVTGLRLNPRAQVGDFLLAEDADEAVGTATSISFRSWVRGGMIPTQGVAWVGTIRTRRRGGTVNEAGIASRIMHEIIRKGREREQVLSYLMPFRGSFYEHFGYGLVERRTEWMVPISIFPKGSTAGLRFCEPGDRNAVQAGYQAAVARGQCELERSAARWDDLWNREAMEGFEVIDRPDPSGPVRGYLQYDQFVIADKDYLRIHCHFAVDRAAFMRQLHFLAGLKDQYFGARITLPGDCPLNWYLTERQLPHRLVNHSVAEAKPVTRLQARVLDHRRLIDSMHLNKDAKGEVVVGVSETEKSVSKFKITIEGGRATAFPTEATPQFECTDVTWAAVVLGGMTATQAVAAGLATATDAQSPGILDTFSVGPAPFCQEGF